MRKDTRNYRAMKTIGYWRQTPTARGRFEIGMIIRAARRQSNR
jgi:hypothetical protein